MCKKKYESPHKMFSEDTCGDNDIPKQVKKYVNDVVLRLAKLEEDTDSIGENFAHHFTKYAKRPILNDLPVEYRVTNKSPPKPKYKKKKTKKKKSGMVSTLDYIPRTVEEWVLNIPTMLDARVAVTMMDRLYASKALADFEDGAEEDKELVKENLERFAGCTG